MARSGGSALRFSRLTIVSGGQTGVDRAAWDAALAAGLPIAGWVPRGRWAEDGPIPPRYRPLRETETDAAEDRTERNVRDADATLILHRGPLTGGTRLTAELAESTRRPCLRLDLARLGPADAADRVAAWLTRVAPRRLNVAGPRASLDPGIYALARRVLERALAGAGPASGRGLSRAVE
jgi:hypothetical protein